MDFRSQKWELLAISRPEIDPEQPIGRYRHEIAIDDKYIYIFGGGTADTVFDLQTLPIFDLEKRKWGEITTLPDPDQGYPKPRKCHSLVQHTITDTDGCEETYVYIAGGIYQGGPLNVTRFFTFHFLLPFIVIAATIIHLLFLHQTGHLEALIEISTVDAI